MTMNWCMRLADPIFPSTPCAARSLPAPCPRWLISTAPALYMPAEPHRIRPRKIRFANSMALAIPPQVVSNRRFSFMD